MSPFVILPSAFPFLLPLPVRHSLLQPPHSTYLLSRSNSLLSLLSDGSGSGGAIAQRQSHSTGQANSSPLPFTPFAFSASSRMSCGCLLLAQSSRMTAPRSPAPASHRLAVQAVRSDSKSGGQLQTASCSGHASELQRREDWVGLEGDDWQCQWSEAGAMQLMDMLLHGNRGCG